MINAKVDRRATMDQFLRRLVTAPRSKQEDMIGAGLRVLEGRGEDALLYNASQTAKLMNCSRQTIWRMQKDGQLRPVTIRGLRRYRRSDLEALVGERGEA